MYNNCYCWMTVLSLRHSEGTLLVIRSKLILKNFSYQAFTRVKQVSCWMTILSLRHSGGTLLVSRRKFFLKNFSYQTFTRVKKVSSWMTHMVELNTFPSEWRFFPLRHSGGTLLVIRRKLVLKNFSHQTFTRVKKVSYWMTDMVELNRFPPEWQFFPSVIQEEPC